MADVLPLVLPSGSGPRDSTPPEGSGTTTLAAIVTRLDAIAKRLDATTGKPLLVDAAGLAKLFNCSKRHIARMRAANELPDPLTLGDGNKVVWKVADIEAFVEAGCDMARFIQAKRR